MGAGAAQAFSDSLSNRFVNLLAVAMGATVVQMGLLSAAKSVSGNVLQLLWGRLSDRHGKRAFISAGRLLNGLVLASFVFTDSPGRLIPLVVASSILVSMALPAWSSLLGDYASESKRGETLGRINAVSQVGGLAAMVIALAVSLTQPGETTSASYMPVMAMAAAMSLFSGSLIILVGEKPPKGKGTPLEPSRVLGDERLVRYLLLNTFYGVGMSFAWPLFPFVVTRKLGMRVWQIATYSVASAASNFLSQGYLGRLMDRVGRRPVIVFSRVIMAAAPVAYALATSWLHVVLAETILGIGMAAWITSESTYVIDMAPGEMRATYLAASTTAFGVASFLGSLLGGYVVERFLGVGGGFSGVNTGLLISAALRLAIGLCYMRVQETRAAP